MRFALLLLFAGTLTAAPVPKELRKAGDKERLVGTWKPADQNSAWFRFEADGTLETWNPPNDRSPMKWVWTDVDSKAEPKRMTLTRVNGGEVYTCPFVIEGDTMRFAFVSKGQQMPSDFPERAGDLRVLVRDK